MKLLFKRGKNRQVINVYSNVYYERRDGDDFENLKQVPFYWDYNGCAVYLGWRAKNYEELDDTLIKERLEIYLDNLRKAISLESKNSTHEVFTSDLSYLNKLIGTTEEEFNKFNVDYKNYLDQQEKEREERYQESLEKERLEELERIQNIKNNIKNNVGVSGRDLLDVMLDMDINCPLRTKGFINKCQNITSSDADLINAQKSKVSQNSVNNMFKWHKIVLNSINEQEEYDNYTQEEKDEINSLFK